MIKKISFNLGIIFTFFLFLPIMPHGYCQNEMPPKTILKVSHIGPTTWAMNNDIILPWIKEVEKLSSGEIKFNIYSIGELDLNQETVDSLLNGDIDISSSVADYSPGHFPLTSVMKLPFLGQSGEHASVVLWNIFENFLQDEYKEFKVLCLCCHGPGQIHTINKEVRSLKDIEGLRIRVADQVLANAISQLGGIPVISTADGIKNLINENKIDGFCLPYEGLTGFQLIDDAHYHTEVNMYTLPIYLLMNRHSYESLPEHLKKIIDKTTGERMSVLSGKIFDENDQEAKNYILKNGHTINTIRGTELELWRTRTMKVGDLWIDDMNKKGLKGQELLTHVVDLFFILQ